MCKSLKRDWILVKISNKIKVIKSYINCNFLNKCNYKNSVIEWSQARKIKGNGYVGSRYRAICRHCGRKSKWYKRKNMDELNKIRK